MVAYAPAEQGGGPGESSNRLGKYQLIRRLATGGMAELFLARATAMAGFEKLVVLKRILPQHAESDDFIRMFLTEARLAATLHHPNIVQVYDIGEQAGSYFFTMEYVQGQDLRKIVRAARKAQRALPLEHILHVIMGIAGGLNHAHEKVGLDGQPLGIVHRDVSPSNVLITYEGSVKIVDFGIAKAATAQTATIAGTLKGKIPYMSPEQCRGEGVDARSDIFSIGTLLWELTTGRRLFGGENEFAILNRVAQGDVPVPSSIRPDYPPELEQIVMRALQADPNDRYASALDLQIDLEDFAREARLPVSSARVGKFMRELFPDEWRQATVDAQSGRSDAPAALLLSAEREDISSGGGTPTPGLHMDSRTGTEGQLTGGSGAYVGPVPGKSRVGVVVAAVAGVALAAGAGVLVLGGYANAWLGTDADPVAPAAVETVIDSPPVEPDPDAADEDSAPEGEAPQVVEPAADADPAKDEIDIDEDPASSDAEAEAEAEDPQAGDPAAESDPAADEAAEPDASKTDEKGGKTSGRRSSRSSKPRRPSKPSKSSKPAKKPKWDPDSPLLPGL